jgi:hypothetical protein
MTRAERIMAGLLLALQLSVITLGLTFVIYHSIQFVWGLSWNAYF